MPDSPPLDLADYPVLDAEGTVTRLKGDKEFLLTLYQVYSDDLPTKLSAIESALNEGNMDNTERSAHSLKGASATVGATAMREAAHALEKAAKEGDAALSRQLGNILQRQAELVLAEIRTVLGQ